MKRNKILGLYFGDCAVGTGLFFPFGVLSLLCSLSKCNVAGSGVSAIGKIGKNVLSPTLCNALPVAGLAISALDLLTKDDNCKNSNYSDRSIALDYKKTISNIYSDCKPLNSYKIPETFYNNKYNNKWIKE